MLLTLLLSPSLPPLLVPLQLSLSPFPRRPFQSDSSLRDSRCHSRRRVAVPVFFRCWMLLLKPPTLPQPRLSCPPPFLPLSGLLPTPPPPAPLPPWASGRAAPKCQGSCAALARFSSLFRPSAGRLKAAKDRRLAGLLLGLLLLLLLLGAAVGVAASASAALAGRDSAVPSVPAAAFAAPIAAGAPCCCFSCYSCCSRCWDYLSAAAPASLSSTPAVPAVAAPHSLPAGRSGRLCCSVSAAAVPASFAAALGRGVSAYGVPIPASPWLRDPSCCS